MSAFGVGVAALAAPAPTLTPAAASVPLVVGSCGDTVRGAPGQPVGVRLASLPVIDVGKVPATGSSTFDATPALREMMGPVAPACVLTAEPISPATAPVEKLIAPALGPAGGVVGSLPALGQPASPGAPAAPPPAPADQPQPAAGPAFIPAGSGAMYGPVTPSFFPYAIGSYNGGFRFNYADLLQLGRPAGGLGRLSATILTGDLFGAPTNGVASLGKHNAAANDVAAAGRASALPASGVERVALPILVAVLMLVGVSVALLRTWVLGRR
ncbi:MAG TPA: hypothetical protein VIY28_04215 [Pseudonocardiaceae bacterium]